MLGFVFFNSIAVGGSIMWRYRCLVLGKSVVASLFRLG